MQNGHLGKTAITIAGSQEMLFMLFFDLHRLLLLQAFGLFILQAYIILKTPKIKLFIFLTANNCQNNCPNFNYSPKLNKTCIKLFSFISRN